MERCKTCRFWIADAPWPEWNGFPKKGEWARCHRWLKQSDVMYGENHERDSSDVIVEDDEMWGVITGPSFGCVLHEPKPE